MASIETVDFIGLKNSEQTNISNVVGASEKNERNDVLLIQTLFKLVGHSDFFSKSKIGLSQKDLPELTGVFDAKTIRAIWAFQRKMAHRLLNTDGKVHPGNYKNRVVKHGPLARQMMITLLNMEAVDGAVNDYSLDVVSAIKKISPDIVFVAPLVI